MASRVQKVSAAGNGVTSVQLVINGVTAGNLLQVSYRASRTSGGTPTLTPSDASGDTWLEAGSQEHAAELCRVGIWYILSASGGNRTITMTASASSRVYACVREIAPGSGETFSLVDSAGNIGTDASMECGSVTTTAKGYIANGWATGGNNAVTIDTDYGDGDANANPGRGGSCDRIITGAITDEPIHSVTANSWTGFTAAFEEAGGGGGGSPQSGTPATAVSTWVALAGIAVMGAVTATPAPAVAQWVTPAPTAVASVTAIPSPAVSTWTAPDPTASTSGAAIPAPAISTWVTPAPVALSGAVTGLPSVSVSQWQALAPTVLSGAVTGTPAPAVSTWVALAPTGSAGVVNQTGIPSPAVSTWTAPQPSALSTFTATAPTASSTWVTPDPSVIAGVATGTAAPSVSSWASPAPTALNPGLHTDLVVFGSDLSKPHLTGQGVPSVASVGLNHIHPKYAGADKSRPKYRGRKP